MAGWLDLNYRDILASITFKKSFHTFKSPSLSLSSLPLSKWAFKNLSKTFLFRLAKFLLE